MTCSSSTSVRRHHWCGCITDSLTAMSELSSRQCALPLALFVLLAPGVMAQRGRQPSVTPHDLARIWDNEHVSPPISATVDHADVVRRLDALAAGSPELFEVEKAGESL